MNCLTHVFIDQWDKSMPRKRLDRVRLGQHFKTKILHNVTVRLISNFSKLFQRQFSVPFGIVAAVRFTRSHKYCCLVLQQIHFFTGRAHHQLWLCRRFTKITRSSSLLLLVWRKHMNNVAMLNYSREQWRHSPLFRLNRLRSKAKNALNQV